MHANETSESEAEETKEPAKTQSKSAMQSLQTKDKKKTAKGEVEVDF